MSDYVPADLEKRDHPVVEAALQKRCKLCHAEPGQLCRNAVADRPLAGRLVHYVRAEFS